MQSTKSERFLFRALRGLYNWSLTQLTFSPTHEVRLAWELQLEIARKCAYRSENIDPDHNGTMRYDIMIEIVKLETRRVEEFLTAFDCFRTLIYDGHITAADENYCDATMISYLDPIQTNVAIS